MGKTVTTYLIDGDPKGTQYAFISNKICQMFVVPRSNLSYLNTQEKLQKPAFYILLGEDESTKPQAYIGETENFKERVKDHDSKKSFWQKALIFVSKDADMTKVDVQYLEHKAIAEAKKANAFVLSDNKQIPKAPNLPEHQQDSMNEFFEDVKFLASFIGCNIFEVSQPKEEHLFYTKGRGCNAKGFYSSDGFTVLKGSTVAKTMVPSFNWKEKREKMLQDYTSTENGILVLTSDKTFSSPSTAADFCIGSSNNGWLVWKDKEGNTLDSVYRKTVGLITYQLEANMEIINLLDFTDRIELREWLKVNHNRVKSCWVVTSRSKQPTYECIPYIEVVEEALCFGWIDSTLKKLPDGCLAQRLSPHRKGSHWTELNKERCINLEDRGLMTDAGHQAFEKAYSYEIVPKGSLMEEKPHSLI